jgi:hypothetical protein
MLATPDCEEAPQAGGAWLAGCSRLNLPTILTSSVTEQLLTSMTVSHNDSEVRGTPNPRKQARKNQPPTRGVRVTAPVLRVYWWAMAILTRSSAWMRWSWLSPPMSICTQLISPVNLLPVGP